MDKKQDKSQCNTDSATQFEQDSDSSIEDYLIGVGDALEELLASTDPKLYRKGVLMALCGLPETATSKEVHKHMQLLARKNPEAYREFFGKEKKGSSACTEKMQW